MIIPALVVHPVVIASLYACQNLETASLSKVTCLGNLENKSNYNNFITLWVDSNCLMYLALLFVCCAKICTDCIFHSVYIDQSEEPFTVLRFTCFLNLFAFLHFQDFPVTKTPKLEHTMVLLRAKSQTHKHVSNLFCWKTRFLKIRILKKDSNVLKP